MRAHTHSHTNVHTLTQAGHLRPQSQTKEGCYPACPPRTFHSDRRVAVLGVLGTFHFEFLPNRGQGSLPGPSRSLPTPVSMAERRIRHPGVRKTNRQEPPSTSQSPGLSEPHPRSPGASWMPEAGCGQGGALGTRLDFDNGAPQTCPLSPSPATSTEWAVAQAGPRPDQHPATRRMHTSAQDTQGLRGQAAGTPADPGGMNSSWDKEWGVPHICKEQGRTPRWCTRVNRPSPPGQSELHLTHMGRGAPSTQPHLTLPTLWSLCQALERKRQGEPATPWVPCKVASSAGWKQTPGQLLSYLP